MDKATLLGGDDSADYVDLGVKGKVQVKGLNRDQVMAMRKTVVAHDGEVDVAEFEARVVSGGLVDPKLTRAEVAAWRKKSGAAADFGKVFDAIATLSGLEDGADKAAYKSAGE